jgi:hypothetical protein
VTPPVLPALRTHRAAAVQLLRTGNPLGAGASRIHDGKAPDGDPPTPYAVVHGYPTAGFDGTTAEPYADVDFMVQVTFVGADPDEADGLADASALLLLNQSLWIIAGRSISQPRIELWRTATRDPDLSSVRFITVLIVAVPTTPA